MRESAQPPLPAVAPALGAAAILLSGAPVPSAPRSWPTSFCVEVESGGGWKFVGGPSFNASPAWMDERQLLFIPEAECDCLDERIAMLSGVKVPPR